MVNRWTRDDLPSISDLCQADDERGNGERTVTLAIALDAVVDRLNKDFPKSYDRGGLRGSTWLERERDMWRDRYRALQSEYARQSQAWSEKRADYEDRLARAETAKREREAAEARTTPAVPLHQPDGTHMDASHLPIDADDDPAVFVVRESDIEDCQRNEDGDWEFRHSGRVFYDSRDPADRAESLTHHREQVAQRVAIIRAIEAEQTDPVEERAKELWEVAQGDGPFIVWEALTDVYRTHYRRIAAHILEQGEA